MFMTSSLQYLLVERRTRESTRQKGHGQRLGASGAPRQSRPGVHYPVARPSHLDTTRRPPLHSTHLLRGEAMRATSLPLVQGTLDLLVLRIVATGPMHGY